MATVWPWLQLEGKARLKFGYSVEQLEGTKTEGEGGGRRVRGAGMRGTGMESCPADLIVFREVGWWEEGEGVGKPQTTTLNMNAF